MPQLIPIFLIAARGNGILNLVHKKRPIIPIPTVAMIPVIALRYGFKTCCTVTRVIRE